MVKKIIQHGDHKAHGDFLKIFKAPQANFNNIKLFSSLDFLGFAEMIRTISVIFVHSVLKNYKEQSYG